MKYSVIIPAYNAEATIRRCMDSLVSQLPDDSEVLLINDGSTDGTEEICRNYSERYPAVKLISKPNGGVSSARNIALDAAMGEYILFVDSDDAVRSDYFSVIDEALKCSPDMLLFRKQTMGKNCPYIKCCKDKIYDDRISSSRFLSKCLQRQELNLITTKAFKRKIVEEHGLGFDERLDIGEDKAFALAFSLYAEKVKTIPNRLYYLSLEDPDSLSRRKRERLYESAMLEHRLMLNTIEKADAPIECKSGFQNAVTFSFYRSAYTVVGELRKFGLKKNERVKKARVLLEYYSNEDSFPPRDFLSRFIAFPVRKKQAFLVDSAVRFFVKRGSL
jgi:glycosyltransferase involved in cell wall biosynthesis